MAAMGGYLFIVARDQTDLWIHLSREFSGEQGVEVRLDRRREERRQQAPAAVSERRRSDRRCRLSLQNELRALNFALIPTD